MAYLGMDVSQAEAFQDYSPLPPGEYHVLVTDSQIRKNPNNGTQDLQFTLKVTDGEHAGRLIFDTFRLWSTSQKAVEYAKRKLHTMATAAHLPGRINDSAELHGKQMIVKVAIDTYNDKERNEVKMYKPLPSGYSPEHQQQQAQPTQAAAQKQKMPWE